MPSTDERKVLLIDTPIISPSVLPLGIPSLVAYLKNKDFTRLDIIDLNRSYYQSFLFYGFSSLFKKWSRVITQHFFLKVLMRADRTFEKALRRQIERMQNQWPWTLKEILKAQGPDTYQRERKRVRRILSKVIQGRYSLIGLSANFPEQLFFSLLIAREIKRTDPAARIVLGGTQVTKHITFLTDSLFPSGLIDYFVIGEGEEPLYRLVQDPSPEVLRSVPNLFFRTPSGYERSEASFRLDPNEFLCPDFQGYDLRYYSNPDFPIIVSRGCPWGKCNFCTYPLWTGQHYRLGTVDHTLEIIRQIKSRYGLKCLWFLDDALTPAFMKELAECLITEKETIKWGGNILLTHEFGDLAFCELLKRSGFVSATVGLESASVRIRTLMNKFHQAMSAGEISLILRTIRSAGINMQINLIFGFPTETKEEAQETLDFALEHCDICESFAQTFFLEADTPVMRFPERFGITRVHAGDKNHGKRLGYRFESSSGMSQKEVERFTKRAQRLLEVLRRFFKNKVAAKTI